MKTTPISRHGAGSRLKIAATIGLAFVGLDLLAQVAAALQTRHALISPLIPERMIQDMVRPYWTQAVVAAAGLGLALLLYRRAKYWLVLILAATTLVAGGVLSWWL